MCNLKEFHGDLYTEEPWDSRNYTCCRLCKTQSKSVTHKHWANGLCRSCYRRLSVQHRKYNDKWIEGNKEEDSKEINNTLKKYKAEESITFSDKDIETVMERYECKCAYCRIDLQIYDTKGDNFLNIEYLPKGDQYEIVPICKICNCSKKNLSTIYDLKKWAERRDIKFPFQYIRPLD